MIVHTVCPAGHDNFINVDQLSDAVSALGKLGCHEEDCDNKLGMMISPAVPVHPVPQITDLKQF